MQSTHIRIFGSVAEFESGTAKEIVRLMAESIRERDVCRLVLSGGSTPEGVYRQLAAEPLRTFIDWSRVQLFFSDERCVPPDDPRSNFGMVKRELLTAVSIGPDHVHRIKGELSPESAAEEYEQVLRRAVGPGPDLFDVTLLGVGEDGHTASLFPASDALHETSRWVCAVYAQRLESWRISITFPCINASRNVLILASGEAKATIIEQALGAKQPSAHIPVTIVRPTQGELFWMLDKQASVRYRSCHH